MRRYILLLMTLCCLNVFAAELPPAPQPEVLKAAIKEFTAAHCNERTTQRSVIPNVNNISQTTVAIYKFRCNARDAKLEALVNAFATDKESSYKYVHELPKTGPLYSTMLGDRRVVTRDNQSKEYYMLCAKNPQNPRDRDMYALSFATQDGVCEGNLYLITSPRPEYDPSQSQQEKPQKEPKVEPKVESKETPKMEPQKKEPKKWVRVCGYITKEMLQKCNYSIFLRSHDGTPVSARYDCNGKFTTMYWIKEDMKLMLKAVPANADDGENLPCLRWTGTFVPEHDYYFIVYPDGFKNVTREEYLSYEKSAKSDDGSVYKEAADMQKLVEKRVKNEQTKTIMTNYSNILNAINKQTQRLFKVDKDDLYYDEAKKNMAELSNFARQIADMMSEYMDLVAKELDK